MFADATYTIATNFLIAYDIDTDYLQELCFYIIDKYHSQIFCWVNSVLYSIVFFPLHNLENLELNHLFFHVLIKNFILIAWLVWLAYFLQE